MPIECDALLFDLDGVLLDSTECIRNTWKMWGEKHGIPFEKIMAVAHGRRAVETIQIVAPHLNAEEEAKPLAAWEAVSTEGVYIVEGALPLVSNLPSNGWAVVTSGTRGIAQARLKATGLPFPKILITAEDVVNGKPNPEPYLAASEQMHIPADKCVVIEDSPAGIEAAHKAGMRAVAVAFTHPRHELVQADAIAERIADIQIADGTELRFAIWVKD
ncbi:MAG: HAD-IA family hydrolase [Chloroflexi bacterium]|nr:HAD-IA family hydrolase [Chloroflexota bacterium]